MHRPVAGSPSRATEPGEGIAPHSTNAGQTKIIDIHFVIIIYFHFTCEKTESQDI